MSVTLKTGDFDAFFDAPFQAYGPDSPYVSPLRADLERFLDARRNPLMCGAGEGALAFFTAHRDGRVLGRITAHEHGASNRLFSERRGYFGYFDCADDPEAAAALLGAAEDWCRSRSLTEIAGNFNLTAMQQIGVVTRGFDHAPYLDQVWSPPHLPGLLAANGYAPLFPMTTFEVDVQNSPPPRLGPKQKALLDDPDFTFAPIKRRTIPRRMEEARQVLNASFAENPMFVPVSAEEFQFQAKDMKWVMDPRISAILHRRGAPVGCIICVPDLNPFLRRVRSRLGMAAPWHFLRHRWTNRRAVLIFAGVVPDLQGQGVNPLLLHHVFTRAQAAGYSMIGNTWIADENGASLAQREKAGAQAMHRLHLFRKAL
ncbi:MAG: GNAT family N-acetyltransferase [Alphaproteobacteria bacterium]|jgi:GNAT superfamily N-acetyltransferase|nr:GNAT family N-acetyltransferase [Alphaproteobacteria bacterium]